MKHTTKIAICLLLLTFNGCLFSTRTVAPTPVNSRVASYGQTSHKQDSDIKSFDKEGVVVYQSVVDRYDYLLSLNTRRPDFIGAQPNPRKVFGIGDKGDRVGISKLPDGTYHMTYHTLMILDRLNSNLRSEQK